MTHSILYCGDTDQNGAAAYLSGLMASWGWSFDYVPSHIPMSAGLLNLPRSLIILSDYPAAMFDLELQKLAVQQIEQGCGLLMIGGWESFHGFGGNWNGTPLGSILPVEILAEDDRINFPQSAFLLPTTDHEITTGLPWRANPPAIGGMNRVNPKPAAQVLLTAHSFAISVAEAKPVTSADPARQWSFTATPAYPALVVGAHGSGRTASFLSDVAPHWVGGLVDWGPQRVTAQAPNAGAIEVGSQYAQFWKQLLQWLSR